MMKKVNKIAIIGILLAIIGAIECSIFYFGKYGITFGSLWMVVRATISCFFFSPSLSATDVYKASMDIQGELPYLTIQSTTYIPFLASLYSFVVLVAPFFTVYLSFWLFFERLYRKTVNALFRKNWEHIYIFGFTNDVRTLVQQGREKCIYTIVVSEALDSKEEIQWNRLNCEVKVIDVLSEEKQLEKLVKEIKKCKAKLLIMERSATKSFRIFCAIRKYAHGQIKDIYLECKDKVIEKSIVDYVDTIQGEENLHLFNSYTLKTNEMLKRANIKDTISAKEDYTSLIIGFSRTGQDLLRKLVNQVVCSSKNCIQIDIFDNDVNSKVSYFLNSISSNTYQRTEEGIVFKQEIADGSLEIHFHNIDINYYQFKEDLKKINKSINTAFVCIDDPDININCMLQLQDFIIMNEKKIFPIVSCVNDKTNINHLLESNSQKNNKMSFVTMNTKDYFTIDTIINEEYEKNAREFNNIYNSFNLLTNDENISDTYNATPWNRLPYFKKNSNYLVKAHSEIVHTLALSFYMENIETINKLFSQELRMNYVQKDDKNVFVFDGSNKDLVTLINANSFIKEMCMVEHRRWCYERALTGWCYSDIKSDSKLCTPCLVTWETLCKENPTYCKYDLMPLIYEFIYK